MPNANARYHSALRELQGRPARPDLRPLAGVSAALALGAAFALAPRRAEAVTPQAMVAALGAAPRVEMVVSQGPTVVTHLYREGDLVRYGDPVMYWRGFDGRRTWSVSMVDKLATVSEGRQDMPHGAVPQVDAALKPYLGGGAKVRELGRGHVRVDKGAQSVEVWFDPATRRPTRIVRAALGAPDTTTVYRYPARFAPDTFAFKPPKGMRVVDLDRAP